MPPVTVTDEGTCTSCMLHSDTLNDDAPNAPTVSDTHGESTAPPVPPSMSTTQCQPAVADSPTTFEDKNTNNQHNTKLPFEGEINISFSFYQK